MPRTGSRLSIWLPRQFLIGASPLADIWSLDGDLQRPHSPLRSRRLGSARHLPSRLASSARHLPSRPAGSACRLARSLRTVRAVLRAVVFLVVVGFPDFVVAIVFLRFCFDVAICPFSSALSSNHASLFADLPSHMQINYFFTERSRLKCCASHAVQRSSPAAFCGRRAPARRPLLVVAIVDTLPVSGVANLGRRL